MTCHFSSTTVEWSTPQDLFDRLNIEFDFVFDVCATPDNAKCAAFYTSEMDGLSRDWRVDVDRGESAWMNPPYDRTIGKWVAKAAELAAERRCVVCLLPARTDTKWWHNHIWDKQMHRPKAGVQIRFLQGRLKFGKALTGAPFPSCIVVFG